DEAAAALPTARDGPPHHLGADAEMAPVGRHMHHLDLAAPHPLAHQTRDVAELEAADRLAMEFGDQHLLVRIGVDSGEGRGIARITRCGIVESRNDAVLYDQADDEG